MTVTNILLILELAEQYGIPFITKMIEDMNKEVLTREDIKKLQDIKPFDEFFPGWGGGNDNNDK
jgi:hypothetical protein